MSKIDIVHTDLAPRAIGPYSQAVVAGGLVYVSGQIPIDPASGEVIEGDIAAHTDRVLRSLAAVLETAGASLSTVVKTTVYLSDMGTFAAMNEVYGRHFGDHRPARATVEAAALPKGVAVEIDAVALVA
ncbi:MAG: RidA family protein [Gemmatimonadota bacterium]